MDMTKKINRMAMTNRITPLIAEPGFALRMIFRSWGLG